MLKRTNPKFLKEVQAEWDALCNIRQDAIDSGKDFSLMAVTAPCIIKELDVPNNGILDVGCGTGYLTSLLATYTTRCVGIDVSAASIDIAKSRYSDSSAVFTVSSIGNFNTDNRFDICVANMVLSCDPDWEQSVQSIYNLLSERGKLLVMLPHPCYWSKYWGFENEDWFNCNEEIYIEHDFSISLVKSLGSATYIHRPLSTYIGKICGAGFMLEKMVEPYPVREMPKEYKYDYPRFLFLKFVKQ